MVQPLMVPAAAARAFVARCLLGTVQSSMRTGSITLRPHQQIAVGRLRELLRAHGGALLADDVGLGKTFVATTILRDATHPLVVAPAALREMWQHALRTSGAHAEVVSYSALGRTAAPQGPFDLVVLDEAHHARTPATRRYARLATLTTNARVLLLTATPIHNSRRDLAALFALFLGARAYTLDEQALARYIVRRERGDVRDVAMPTASEPRWIHVCDDTRLLELILALPPPLPPSDGEEGGVLLTWSLARQWASSTGALAAAVRRRLLRASALDAALAQGHHLARRELAMWECGDDAVQLAFPGLLAAHPVDGTALRAALAAHEHALRDLLRAAQAGAVTDTGRARCLEELRANHPDEKIVAFSQFTATVATMFRLLRHRPGVAALTARGALVAGGSLTRAEALARFAPRASFAGTPREIERIDLLLTTDLLSEGVNLHDASVVVHLDLPWTGARLEQRVGRSRRMGATHSRTAVYAFAPPASSEVLLRVEERLRAKLRAASRATGVAGTILPGLASAACEDSAARVRERMRIALEGWREDTLAPPQQPCDGVCVLGIVRTTRQVLLALVHEGDGGQLLLAALHEDALQDAPLVALRALELLGGESCPAPSTTVERAMALASRWLQQRGAALATGIALPLHAPVRRTAIRRISTITAHAPLHRRPALAALAAGARRAVTVPCGIGAEAVLGEIVHATMPDEAWLRALAAFGAAHGAAHEAVHGAAPHEAVPYEAAPPGAGAQAPHVVAMIIGVPGTP